MPEYDIFEHKPVVNAVGGDYTTGTDWDEEYEQGQTDRLNAILRLIGTDMTYIMSLVAQGETDTLSFSWASVDAITVHPGLAIAGDGTQHSVANDTTLSLDSNLDTGTRAADTIYFVWIGEDTVSGETKLLLSANADTPPTALVSDSAYRLKDFFNTSAANSNIEQFVAALPTNFPAGMMLPWNAPYKPAGCHWAHGQEVSRTHAAYADIFALYGETWGAGDASTTFNLPDTQGRSPMGAGSGDGLTTRALADTVGEEEHALTSSENGPHTHAQNNTLLSTFGNSTFSISGGTAYINIGGETQSSGLGHPHNTTHPVFVTNFIIKG